MPDGFKVGVDMSQPVAVGIDLDIGRFPVFEPEALGTFDINSAFGETPAGRKLHEVAAHAFHPVEVLLYPRDIRAILRGDAISGTCRRRKAAGKQDKHEDAQQSDHAFYIGRRWGNCKAARR